MIEMFKIALDFAAKKVDQRLFIVGACGLRQDQKLVVAKNSPVMIDQNVMNGYQTRYPYPHKHAESSLIRKLGKNSPAVWVSRGRKLDNKLAMARPCQTCETLLGYAGVEKVYYTISEIEYGLMFLKSKKDDKIYQF